MKKSRAYKAKMNIITSLVCTLVTTVCGLVIPRAMIGAFGSVVYGATTSIAQFLSYISLFEGGIGRVSRSALYKPLAEHDNVGISRVYYATRHFLFCVGIAFLGYTLIVALGYYDIARVTALSWKNTFFLVWAISLSTLMKYMGGLSDLTLLNADQKQYITNGITVLTNVINTISIVILVSYSCDVVIVKLVSSLIFILRPIIFSVYVKKNYSLTAVERQEAVLTQKWTGFGQHLAYFLHTNTDIVILTLFADLRMVSVYAVYSLVIVNIRNITCALSGGMEAVFGEMVAKREQDALRRAYRRYKMLLFSAGAVMFGVTAILIVPFVRLYTAGISDADYSQFWFAEILLFAEAMNCLALPCSTLPVSANKLKATRWGAYGEALINLSFSCVLVFWNPLMGVAIGTLISAIFKNLFYSVYAAKYILKERISHILGCFLQSLLVFVGIAMGGSALLNQFEVRNYGEWCVWGAIFFIASCVIVLLANCVLFSEEQKQLLENVVKKCRKSVQR